MATSSCQPEPAAVASPTHIRKDASVAGTFRWRTFQTSIEAPARAKAPAPSIIFQNLYSTSQKFSG